MSESEIEEGKKGLPAPAPKKKSRAGRVVGIIAVVLLLAILVTLLVNAILTLFMPHYYPTFGNKRLFAVVTDSMTPEIPTGSMIVDTVPEKVEDIQIGTVITFEVVDGNGKVTEVLTHRVVAFGTGEHAGLFLTRGDNAPGEDSFHPSFENIIGIYTGARCPYLGSFFGWLHTTWGMTWMFILVAFIIIIWCIISALGSMDSRRKKENAALKRSAQELSNVNLRYDNIREITAVLDVLDMVTDETDNRSRRKEIEKRLDDFVSAESIELPHNPETAALLDSLPAPDTPLTLASALRSGATLRQAEDGQTLILTGISGGKSILLTPVQTPDGIILCQQGVRLKSDLAPNIENIGVMSMPEYPEFFEGQPIKKNVEYPELPQPKTVGVDLLSPHGTYPAAEMPAIASGKASEVKSLESGKTDKPSETTDKTAVTEKPTKPEKPPKTPEQLEAEQKRREARRLARQRKKEEAERLEQTRLAYEKYRENAAQLELKQTEELHDLLNRVTPLNPDDKERIDRIRAEQRLAKKQKPKPAKKPKTPEQLAAQKERAAARKAEQQAFLDSLSPADRELYLSEQRLAKSRAAAIRRLKRIEADKKLLESL